MSYGNGLKTAFDLNRFELLKSLHFALPFNLASERGTNAKISEFFVRGKDYDLAYEHDGSQETKNPRPAF
jgi:hypothetical protein